MVNFFKVLIDGAYEAHADCTVLVSPFLSSAETGLPENVVKAHRERRALVGLRFDFSNDNVHQGMEVKTDDTYFHAFVSFDKLYRVKIPWESFVTFNYSEDHLIPNKPYNTRSGNVIKLEPKK